MTPTQYFESTDQVQIQKIGEDECFLVLGESKHVFSYDAIYDLALRLAGFIHHVQGSEPESKNHTLN